MSNKDVIKKVFDQKINKNEIYDTILKKTLKKQRMNLSYVLVPVCLICLFYFSIRNKIIINDLNLSTLRNINENYQIAENKINYVLLENIDISDDFTLDASFTSNEKNIVVYSNNSKFIKISFSKENINKELIKENDKISKINNKKINLYKFDKTYMALFEKENIYYNIETNTNKNDFLSLIKSIIK